MEVKLPNGTVGQILDIMDYVSNNVLMPIVALATCILVGWIVSPKVIIDEVTRGGSKFTRKGLYIIMVKFIAPAFLLILLLQALGIITFRIELNLLYILYKYPENAVIKDQVKLFNISPDAGNVKLTATLYDKETGEQILDADD